MSWEQLSGRMAESMAFLAYARGKRERIGDDVSVYTYRQGNKMLKLCISMQTGEEAVIFYRNAQ